jgi:hypothetical protein
MNPDHFGPNAQLAMDTLCMKACSGIPSWIFHTMDIPFIEHLTGSHQGAYRAEPDEVYTAFQRKVGTCLLDQYLADNPLTMGGEGYSSEATRGATTGAHETVLDSIPIDSPEAVVEHMERVLFPDLEKQIRETDPAHEESWASVLQMERELQERLGDSILKSPYGDAFNGFPKLRYQTYGYENYLLAFALYPEVMEKDFRLQSDLAVLTNLVGVRAIQEGCLPGVIRSDHDMASSRGMLVKMEALDKIWFPYFERAIKPYTDAGIRLIWHCDGNLMEMVPRLIEVGISGFQGFQYEDGMDYERICQLKTREGEPLMIWGGVSVTRTLPFGTPDDVRRELDWLVAHAPPVGFFLGASSTIVPGVSWENLKTLIEGFAFYRERGRPSHARA